MATAIVTPITIHPNPRSPRRFSGMVTTGYTAREGEFTLHGIGPVTKLWGSWNPLFWLRICGAWLVYFWWWVRGRSVR